MDKECSEGKVEVMDNEQEEVVKLPMQSMVLDAALKATGRKKNRTEGKRNRRTENEVENDW